MIKYFIKSFLIIFCFLLLLQCKSQTQYFKTVFYAKDLIFKDPTAWGYENLFSDDWKNYQCIKTNPYQCTIKLKRPEIISLINTQLLAIPDQIIHGTFNSAGNDFKIMGTNNINQLIIGFENWFQAMKMRYNDNRTVNQFLAVSDTMKRNIDSTLKFISEPEVRRKYGITDDINSAFTQICMAELAHFYMLPVLYKADYQFNKITDLVRKNIKISNPNYWLQIQSGRVFLRTFFKKCLSQDNETDPEKLLDKGLLFKDTLIKKYVGYQYFLGLINDDTGSVNADVILKKFNEFENKYRFSVSEKKTIEKLKMKYNLLNKNIVPLFNKEPLSNYSGKIIGKLQDTLLRSQGKVILYYWASWCVPCLATINKLNSDEINFEGEHYKIVFISIDDKRNRWVAVHKKVLNVTNSFIISKLSDDSFYYFFKIWQEIPRLFLIDNGILINQNFSREEFYKIFGL